MATNPFRYRAYDLVPMTYIDDLPYEGVSFGGNLNSPGSWSGVLPLADPRVQQTDWMRATRTGRTALFVDLAGEIVWGGIIWTTRYQESAPGKPLTVGAMEMGSYLQQRLQPKDYTVPPAGGSFWNANPADPMAIVAQVVTDAQLGAVTFPGITTGRIGGTGAGGTANGITVVVNGTTPTGAYVTATYPGTQLQTIDSIISTLSQMGYTAGFDYSWDCQYISGTTAQIPAITLNLWYPRKGQVAAQTNLVVTMRDIIDFTYDVDSTTQALGIAETASGSGGITAGFGNVPSLLSPSSLALTAVDSDFETGMGSWVAPTGFGSIAQSSAQAHTGSYSLAITCGAASYGAAETGVYALPASGLVYTVTGWFRAATTPRTVNLALVWCDVNGHQLGTGATGTGFDSASGWTEVTVKGTAPPLAVKVQIAVEVTGASTEVHYLDTVNIATTPNPNAGYPPLERLIPRSQVNDPTILEQCVDGDLDLYANPPPAPTITVPLALPLPTGGTDPKQIGFADFSTGDDLIWKLDPYTATAAAAGLNVSPRFPNGMNFEWRIVSWACTPSDSGVTTLTFTLGLPPTTLLPPISPPT